MEKVKKVLLKLVNKITNIGGSLQTPIAILPAAGILLALGTIFTSSDFLKMMPFTDTPFMHNIFNVLLQCGAIIFGNLPLIFAAGVAIGLSNNDGVAALSAIVGYLIMNVTIGGTLNVTSQMVASSRQYATILGIPTLQTGVLGGIIIGVLASSIYNKFHDVKLPKALEFFAGKRSVPILTAFISVFVGLLMTIIWPPIQGGINNLSNFIVHINPAIAGFMFGFVERLTIPFGMNHVWWPTFWLQAGQYINKAGNVINGDQLIFFSQLADKAPITVGTFMNGLFVLKMFSMPAVALAMYKCARPEQKEKVYGILLSGAITAFVAGITEPLEFLFIFSAPGLFLIYAVVTGLGFAVMNILGAHLGLSFSGGFLDYIFFNVIPNRTNWWILIPVGIVFFVIYYALFVFAIKHWNLKTPGREKIVLESGQANLELNDNELIEGIIGALGGSANIKNVNACYSRLRVDVLDPGIVQKDEFSHLQSSGVSMLGQNVQVIYGTRAVSIKEAVLAKLHNSKATVKKISGGQENANISSDPKKIEKLVAPFEGETMRLNEVPDEVFASKKMGDGFAINLGSDTVMSPVNGEVMMVFGTKHAIGLLDEYKNEILLHIGLDTVNLNGEYIKVFVKAGDKVKVGQKIAEVDSKAIKEKGYSLISPIIFTNLDSKKYGIDLEVKGHVSSGQGKLIKVKERK